MNPIDFWQANHLAGLQALSLVPIEDVVLVVADTRDPLAQILVSAFAEKEGMDLADFEEKTVAKEMIPTAHLVLGREDARQIFEGLDLPGVASALANKPPSPGVVVVLMMEGHSACLITRRLPFAAHGVA
jgi:hypothetical protein